MPKPVLFLDLDGVLADFTLGMMAAHNRFLVPKTIQWDFWTQMGLTETEFWSVAGFDFWANLPWWPDGKEFLGRLELIFGEENIALLTSPAPDYAPAGSLDGKAEWIKRNLPYYSKRRQFLIGSAKNLAACPSKVLVDDYHRNTDAFRAANGSVVLVPRPWNYRSAETDENGYFDPAAVAYDVDRLYRNLLRD